MPARDQILSPEFRAIKKYAKEAGFLNELVAGKAEHEDLGIGSYDVKGKSAVVLADAPDAGDSTFSHEVVHPLRFSGVEPRSQKFQKKMQRYVAAQPLYRRMFGDPEKDIVLPKHWVDQKMGSTAWSESPRVGLDRVTRLARETGQRRLEEVKSAIPEGASWSGLTREGDEYGRNERVEGDAYYLTKRDEIARPLGERATEFGLHLLDYGFPMEIVEPAVRRLEKIAAPKYRYSGGSQELYKLRKSFQKEKYRVDGSHKGKGFLGELQRPDGSISTEISIGVNLSGKETEIPLLVPTLSEQEIDYLLRGGKPTESIMKKAVSHAQKRIAKGKSPFAD